MAPRLLPCPAPPGVRPRAAALRRRGAHATLSRRRSTSTASGSTSTASGSTSTRLDLDWRPATLAPSHICSRKYVITCLKDYQR